MQEDVMASLPANCQATLTIDLPAIVDNYLTVRQLAGGTDAAAMVKADAYGMGLSEVAPALFHEAGCRNFFVANLAEAVALRSYTPDACIYVLNGLFPGHEDYFSAHDLRPVINSLEQLELWKKSCASLPCALHFDTGINRLGFSPDETVQLLRQPNSTGQVNIALVMSHLACADDEQNSLNLRQLDAFRKITSHFPGIPASLANSGGILLGPEYHFDMVRPGLLLFGGNPSASQPLPAGIRPAFTITGRILQVRELREGMSVGYGSGWTAPHRSRIAIVNIGYADGYLQVFNNVGHLYLQGSEVPVIGRVSMDMLAIDISDAPFAAVSEGDEIELLGQHITLEKASELSNLSQYEILTGVRERYQRVYIPVK
ncbi:alanine racemase [Emcibacter sp.]|uniref:alanine racemase n=1 Tax=Emcibacter sp. TaxID=1979954 RepID=UPI002AA60EEE|nr:alanine racemase [Emcibacter sp.]